MAGMNELDRMRTFHCDHGGGVTIGSRCIIAAGSVVVGDIPDDCMAAGNPAVVKRWLNG